MRYLVVILLILCFSFTKAEEMFKESDFIKNSRQLIYEGKRSGEGYFSADGRYMIFQSERLDDNPFYQMFILDFETGDITQVTPGKGKTTCAFFKGDKKEVLFSSTHKDPEAIEKQEEEFELRKSSKKRRYSWDYDKTMDVFTSDMNGENIKQLTDAVGYDAEASYSPDGSKIVFASNRSAYEGNLSEKEKKQMEINPSYFCELYIMDADGSNLKRLTNTPGYDGGPFFSPDGNRIVWRRFSPDGHLADVYTMNIDGSDVKQLTEFSSMSWAPYYHPSGEYIIFASNKHGYGNFELFLVDTEGKKQPVRVTYTDGFDGLPVFHPDGNKIAWTSNRTNNGKAQIFFGQWNHKTALKAVENAPLRSASGEIEFTAEIKENEIKQKVEYLSSDQLEGRMTGSEGIRLAADYIIADMKKFGLEPVDMFGDYRVPFSYISEIEIDKQKNKLKIGDVNLEVRKDYTPLTSSSNGEISGKAMFVGFGIKTPETADFSINSFNGIDVTDKVLFMLDDMPSSLSDEQKKDITRYASRMYKVLTARDLGAKGVVFISNRKTLSTPRSGGMILKSGLFLAEMTKETAKKVFEKDLDKVIESANNYNPHEQVAFTLKKRNVEGNFAIEKVYNQDYNILGMIPASNGSEEMIFIGGHYDHLGYGEGGSLAPDSLLQEIHNGADDNASGTAVVMELAEYFAKVKEENPELITKNLVFAFWSGEELGLLGSAQLTDTLEARGAKVAAYLNYDMVGMLKDNKLSIQGIGSADEWKKIIEKKNVLAGFNLALQDDPYLPTDATSFYKIKVPVAAFFTGLHDHYHRPSDDAENLDYNGAERIASFSAKIIRELLEEDTELTYKKVEMKSQGNVRGFSVYLGTIPDYVADVEGVKLTGVRAGGPAAKAGLQGDDIIVELGGKDIKNIYDYTNILADLEAGKKYIIKVKRKGELKELEIVPGSK